MSNHQQNNTGISVRDEIDAIAQYLTDGFYEWEKTQDSEIYGGRRAFDVQTGGSLTADITKLTPAGQQLARWALEAWTNVIGIRFALVEDENANITFDDDEEGAFAYSTQFDSDEAVIISSHVNVQVFGGDATGMDSELFVTYLHEIGHALGLGHPGPYDPDTEPVFADFTVFRHDSAQTTVMTYFYQDENPNTDASFAFPVTPMIADIIAIQALYGTPASINTGDTRYGPDSNADGYLGEFFRKWTGGELQQDVALTLYDNSGNDTLDLSTDTRDQYVDLRPEGISDVYGLKGNLVIARDTLVENFMAGSGDDRIIGNATANHLVAGAGDDVLEGGAGADMLNGGPGSDTATYANSAVAVLVRLHDPGAVRLGDAEGDTLTGIEHLIGSRYNDTLAGDGEDNIMKGGDGDDVLYGGPAGGDDMMYGGNGDDRVFGGRGDDTLTGGEGNDVLKGGPGEDTLIADGNEMDVLNGGPDDDTFQFFSGNIGGGTIQDFTDGEDMIDLTEFIGISSLDDLDIVSHGDNVRIEVSGTGYLTTIILSDFDAGNLDAADFIFVS